MCHTVAAAVAIVTAEKVGPCLKEKRMNLTSENYLAS